MTKKAKNKRKKIILSIFDKMLTVDFEQITIKALCDAADISVGTFYHYFKDKSGFFIQIFSLFDDYIEEELLPTLTDENEINNFLNFCNGFATYTNGYDVKILRSIYSSVLSFSNEHEMERPFFRIPYEILLNAQKKQQISPDFNIEDLTKALIISLRGYVYDWAWHEGSYDLVEYIHKFAVLFINALKLQGEKVIQQM